MTASVLRTSLAIAGRAGYKPAPTPLKRPTSVENSKCQPAYLQRKEQLYNTPANPP